MNKKIIAQDTEDKSVAKQADEAYQLNPVYFYIPALDKVFS